MEVNWPLVGFLGAGAMNLIALTRAYYGLKADNAKLSADITLQLANEKTERREGQTSMKNELMVLINHIENEMKELTRRLSTLENGQDEWTKALRDRTHELADKLQVIVLKVDRLEHAHPAKDGE